MCALVEVANAMEVKDNNNNGTETNLISSVVPTIKTMTDSEDNGLNPASSDIDNSSQSECPTMPIISPIKKVIKMPIVSNHDLLSSHNKVNCQTYHGNRRYKKKRSSPYIPPGIPYTPIYHYYNKMIKNTKSGQTINEIRKHLKNFNQDNVVNIDYRHHQHHYHHHIYMKKQQNMDKHAHSTYDLYKLPEVHLEHSLVIDDYMDNQQKEKNNHVHVENKENIPTTKNKKKIVHLKKSTRKRSHSQSNTKHGHGHTTMVLPRKIFPKYHDKSYHKRLRRKYLPKYKMCEIVKHNKKESCWIIVDDLVLDVTKFMKYHPGEDESILKYGGTECDSHFAFHSNIAKKLFWKFVIGQVDKSQNKSNTANCIIQ